MRARIHLQADSFDGFSVLWTSGPGVVAECRIGIRFNFLSTDFTHAKGVKGILTRLCAKTTVVSPPLPEEVPEISFCEVKVFRDHGAERKLTNDIALVRKRIQKLEQQIPPLDTKSAQRRRDRPSDMITSRSRENLSLKRKRTWSVSSTGRASKLQIMQNMLTSTRPESVFCSRGQEGDDPDLHPVQIESDSPDFVEGKTEERADWQQETKDCSLEIEETLICKPSPTFLKPPDQLGQTQKTRQENPGTPTTKIGAPNSFPSSQRPPSPPIKPGALSPHKPSLSKIC